MLIVHTSLCIENSQTENMCFNPIIASAYDAITIIWSGQRRATNTSPIKNNEL